jgi:leucyl aminopeptidase
MSDLIVDPAAAAVPVWFVTTESWPGIRDALPEGARRFAEAMNYAPVCGRCLCLPDARGGLGGALFAVDAAEAAHCDLLLPGKLATIVPAATYRFANRPPGGDRGLTLAALSWLLSSYAFRRYKTSETDKPRLLAPEGVDAARLTRIADAIAFGRDLVNTPANDLGPSALEEAALAVAARGGASARVLRGERLLRENFPLIHAVGRAAAEEPRLVDFTWGPADGPKATLVGKGVCFDTGGLDLKPASAMALMKKDMAGAATALTLARMVMDAGLSIRLRVLLPIVENAVSAGSFRPGDIYPSRKGISVEIGNTDAEGRLILADALTLADEETPQLLLDFATLTGAARVALGPDLPPFYTDDDDLAREIADKAAAVADPVWRMPLWRPYEALLESKLASTNNVSSGPFAGSIVAALFLARFASSTRSWAHFDVYGWNPSTKPGRPEGGEIQVARLLFELIESRFG